MKTLDPVTKELQKYTDEIENKQTTKRFVTEINDRNLLFTQNESLTNKILLFLIDILDNNPQKTFDKLKKELHTFNETLMDKPTLVVRTKLDTIQNPETLDQWNGFSEEYIDISSVSNSGLDNLKDRLVSFLSSSV